MTVETIVMVPYLRAAGLFCLLSVCMLSGGCVALAIPSERFHDPQDHGGLLGDWRPGPSTHVPHEIHESCSDCGDLPAAYPLDLDPVTGQPIDKTPPPPEVPWPRYHPVPTRPVL